ncbi:MAG: hypothetical protein J4N98_06310 [Chloroflexi bacterium]|nr:hypothetical protein [Chloroflexota bacterium]
MNRVSLRGILFAMIFSGLVVSFVAEVGRSPAAAQEPSGLAGDANLDNAVDALDAALTLTLNAGLIGSVPSPENADVDENGSVDALDSALIMELEAGLLDVLPPTLAGTTHATGTASIGSGTGDVGEEISVDLEALNVTQPGLGAWTIDILYDATILSATGCGPGICNPCFGALIPPPPTPCETGTVRVVGATASGRKGDSLLSTITFLCRVNGASALTIPGFGENPSFLFHDATIGAPQPIDVTIVNGSITCEPPPAVGGVPLDSALRPLPLETGHSPSSSWGIAVAIVTATCLVVVAGGAWYTRRRATSS